MASTAWDRGQWGGDSVPPCLIEFVQLPLLSALGHVPFLSREGMARSLSLVQAQPGHWNTPGSVPGSSEGMLSQQGPRAGHCHLCQLRVGQGPRMAGASLGTDTAGVPTPPLWGRSYVQQCQSRAVPTCPVPHPCEPERRAPRLTPLSLLCHQGSRGADMSPSHLSPSQGGSATPAPTEEIWVLRKPFAGTASPGTRSQDGAVAPAGHGHTAVSPLSGAQSPDSLSSPCRW